ncbi:MAG: hypothetical protein ABIV13_04555 [Fimbriimonadales bacterium]
MKIVRTGAMALAFVSLVGGYFGHQYSWFVSGGQKFYDDPRDLTPFGEWIAKMLPITIVLGWVILLTAIVLSFSKPDEEKS